MQGRARESTSNAHAAAGVIMLPCCCPRARPPSSTQGSHLTYPFPMV